MPDIGTDAPLSPHESEVAVRLLDLATRNNVDPIHLDEAVHDAAARYASDECNSTGAVDDDSEADEIYEDAGRQAADINNGGLSRQVPYLVGQYGAEDAERIIRGAGTDLAPRAQDR